MPSQVVFDIFPLPGVTPNYQHSITGGNAILANNAKGISVTMKVGKVIPLSDKTKGVGTSKNVTGGDMRTGGTTAGDWRYSQQQREILGNLPEGSPRTSEPMSGAAQVINQIPLVGSAIAQAITPSSGAMPVVWSEGMTQGGRLGEAVNPRVWDTTYTGRSGIFMHNGAAAYDAVLLHETLHMCGLHHVGDATNVMHATMTGTSDQNKLTDAQKQSLKDASF